MKFNFWNRKKGTIEYKKVEDIIPEPGMEIQKRLMIILTRKKNIMKNLRRLRLGLRNAASRIMKF